MSLRCAGPITVIERRRLLGRVLCLKRRFLSARLPTIAAFTGPKRSGGKRGILTPKRELKALRKVLDGLVANVPTAPAVHGLQPGGWIRA
jgi:hypothetical protein